MNDHTLSAVRQQLAIVDSTIRALHDALDVLRAVGRAEGIPIPTDAAYWDVLSELRRCQAARDRLRAAWEVAQYTQRERLIAVRAHAPCCQVHHLASARAPRARGRKG